MLKVAITGNIASGKSQVEKIISNYFPVFDTDKIAHNILDKITDFNGYDVFTNNKIDRLKLGKLVFSDPNIKQELENIIHPKVKEEIIRIFNSNKKIVFISIPLLFETGFDKLFDKIIFIQTNDNIRLERLMKRNNFTQDEAILRIESQAPQETKIKKSDYIINNNSSIEDLNKQVLILIREFSSFM